MIEVKSILSLDRTLHLSTLNEIKLVVEDISSNHQEIKS